jgi:hypothetical protein
VSNGHVRSLAALALDQFHHPAAQLFADRDAVGDVDQVGLFELHARPLVAVVEQGIEPQRQAVSVNRARRSGGWLASWFRRSIIDDE